jgi:hypothetical protein
VEPPAEGGLIEIVSPSPVLVTSPYLEAAVVASVKKTENPILYATPFKE